MLMLAQADKMRKDSRAQVLASRSKPAPFAEKKNANSAAPSRVSIAVGRNAGAARNSFTHRSNQTQLECFITTLNQWASLGQVLVLTSGRKSDGVSSWPVEVGRMSHIVTVTIRPSFGNTIRSSAPNPRAIQTYSVESGSLYNHHLKPYLNPSL